MNLAPPSPNGSPRCLEQPLAAAYLRRLRVDERSPSVESLFVLHRAHVERVPYETFWIHLDEGWSIDPVASAIRIASGARGGYCFHQNGALAALLTSLGYDVTLHVAGVHGANGPAVAEMGNHVALIVHGLATETNPGGDWYVDAGLGDGLYEPLPFVAGQFDQAGLRFGFGLDASNVGDWHLSHDPTGSFAGVSISAVPCRLEEFGARHEFNATSSQSPFARTVTCQRRHATGTDVMRAKVYTRRDGPNTTTVVASTLTEWLEILGDVFGLRLTAPPSAVESLWARVCAAHDTWTSTPTDHDHHAPLVSA